MSRTSAGCTKLNPAFDMAASVLSMHKLEGMEDVRNKRCEPPFQVGAAAQSPVKRMQFTLERVTFPDAKLNVTVRV